MRVEDNPIFFAEIGEVSGQVAVSSVAADLDNLHVKAGDPAKRRKSTMADETENQTAESQPHQAC